MSDVSVPTTPTNPDLREQIQRVLRDRCEVEDRQYTDGTGWVLVRDDNAAQVVADYFAPVLEGLRAELDRQRESRIAWALEADRLQQERDALSSLLRGMARRVGQMRRELAELRAVLVAAEPKADLEGYPYVPSVEIAKAIIRQRASYLKIWGSCHDRHVKAEVEVVRLRRQLDEERQASSVSDQTPATPDEALTIAMSAARKVSILPPSTHVVMAMLDSLAKAGFLAPTPVIADLRATAADLLAADDVTEHDQVAAQTLTDYADRLGKAAPSSVQGDTTPEEA